MRSCLNIETQCFSTADVYQFLASCQGATATVEQSCACSISS